MSHKTDGAPSRYDPARPNGSYVSSSVSGGNHESRHSIPFITVERERDGDGWLARRGPHSWLHGSFRAALDDSAELVAIEWGRR